jgi:hypothetical protein
LIDERRDTSELGRNPREKDKSDVRALRVRVRGERGKFVCAREAGSKADARERKGGARKGERCTQALALVSITAVDTDDVSSADRSLSVVIPAWKMHTFILKHG